MKRKPRISATGYMLLLSPCDDGIKWRVEFFSEAGNFMSYIELDDKAAAVQRRRRLYRLHERIARERRDRAASKAAEGKPDAPNAENIYRNPAAFD